jgi:PGF-pre-PGF domain-containing protein
MLISHNLRKGCEIKKILGCFIVTCILIISLSLVFVISVGADEEAVESAANWLKDNYDKSTTETTTPEPKTTETTTVTTTPETKTTETNSPEPKTSDTSTTNDKDTDTYTNSDKEDSEKIFYNAINSDLVDEMEDEVKNNYTKIIEITVEKEIGNITLGEKVTVKPQKSNETSIVGVEFVTSIDIENVKFTVATLNDKPVEITEEPKVNGIMYKYLDIKLTSNDIYLHEEEFETIKFEFKVEKTWIYDNNIDKNTITLIRYNNGWKDLTTILLQEDDNFIYYEAETPGLSTYTVVGTQIVEASPSIIKEKVLMPLTGWIAIIAITTIILIMVIYKLGFIYKTE